MPKGYTKKNNSNPNIAVVSKLGLIFVICFIFFSVAGRVLFPFGDEPDFTYRANLLINSQHSWWSPYYLLQGILDQINFKTECQPEAGALSLWASIDSVNCTESIYQILYRLLITMIVTSPLLLALIFQQGFVKVMKKIGGGKDNEEWKTRFNSMGISLLFPSMIYYLGVFSLEQFSLVLSLLIFLVWNTVYIFPLIILMYTVDPGNTIVVCVFIIIYYTLKLVFKKVGVKKVTFSLFLFLFSILFFRDIFFSILSNVPLISDKLLSMAALLKEQDLVAKYPVLLRPAITFMTGVFMTPSGIKIPSVYIFVGLLLLLKTQGTTNRKTSFFNTLLTQDKVIYLYASLTTILLFVFLFPNYVNAKYYIFMLPFLIFTFINPTQIKRMAWVGGAISSITFVQLFLYRL